MTFDLWPLTLKAFSAISTHVMNIWVKFYRNPSTKYRDIASREIGVNGRTMDGRMIGRTTRKYNASAACCERRYKKYKKVNEHEKFARSKFIVNGVMTTIDWLIDRLLCLLNIIQHARTLDCMKSEVVHLKLSLCIGRLIGNNCTAYDFFVITYCSYIFIVTDSALISISKQMNSWSSHIYCVDSAVSLHMIM